MSSETCVASKTCYSHWTQILPIAHSQRLWSQIKHKNPINSWLIADNLFCRFLKDFRFKNYLSEIMKVLFALIALGYARREKKKSSTEILYGKNIISLVFKKFRKLSLSLEDVIIHTVPWRPPDSQGWLRAHTLVHIQALTSQTLTFNISILELLQTDYDKNIRPYYLIKPVDISIDIFMNSFGSGSLTDFLNNVHFHHSVSMMIFSLNKRSDWGQSNQLFQ